MLRMLWESLERLEELDGVIEYCHDFNVLQINHLLATVTCQIFKQDHIFCSSAL